MSLNNPHSYATQKQLVEAANQIAANTKRAITITSTRNKSLGKTFNETLERRVDSSENAPE